VAGTDGGAQPIHELGPDSGDQRQTDHDEQDTADSGNPAAVAADEPDGPEQARVADATPPGLGPTVATPLSMGGFAGLDAFDRACLEPLAFDDVETGRPHRGELAAGEVFTGGADGQSF
jgi:hypothetical protein